VREQLRRHVHTAAATAGSRDEFEARLAERHVLVHYRFSTQVPDQVTGVSFSLGTDRIRYSGGRLAPDLSWPKLRARWENAGSGQDPVAAPWQEAERIVRQAADSISRGEPGTEAAAWAAGDVLRSLAWAVRDEDGPWRGQLTT
jgi:hypothetical protein